MVDQALRVRARIWWHIAIRASTVGALVAERIGLVAIGGVSIVGGINDEVVIVAPLPVQRARDAISRASCSSIGDNCRSPPVTKTSAK